jgi:hypothetical protein
MQTIATKRSAIPLLAFWSLAAFIVMAASLRLDRISATGSVLAKVAVILLVAFAYMRLGVRHAAFEHALFAGIVWASLSLIAEMVMAIKVQHPWGALIGSPAHDILRDVLLLAWIAAPAVFARRDV